MEQTAKDREQNSPAALANLITALKDVLPDQGKESSGAEKSEALAIISAIKGLQQDPLAVMRQAKDLFAPVAASEQESPRNHIAELDQILGFAQKLGMLRGGGGDRNGWDIGLDYASELGTPILQLVSNWMALRGGVAPSAFPPAVAQSAAPAPLKPYPHPELMRQHARALNAQSAAPAAAAGANPGSPLNPATQAPLPNGAPAPNQIMPLFGAYGGLIVNALNTGCDGVEFAEHVSRLFGASIHATIAQEGEDTLVNGMACLPGDRVIWRIQNQKFAHEFIHDQEILDDEQEEEPENAASAKA